MSESSYAHYQGPSSLPSNYAILTRLSTNYESCAPQSQPENTAQITRPESFPVSTSQYSGPLNPTIGVYPSCSSCVEPHSEASQHLTPSPSETSPLLNHPLRPRFEENIEYNASDKTSTVKMFWEELVVLTKYTIPNFAYAPFLRSFIFHES
jgi:multidrug resistance protein, MATE family